MKKKLLQNPLTATAAAAVIAVWIYFNEQACDRNRIDSQQQ